MMPRGKRKTVEGEIKKLEDRKEDYIREKVLNYEKRLRAQYESKIELLKEKGLPIKTKEEINVYQMVEKGKDRFIFYKTRYYIHSGLSPEEAGKLAEGEFMKYRDHWLGSVSR